VKKGNSLASIFYYDAYWKVLVPKKILQKSQTILGVNKHAPLRFQLRMQRTFQCNITSMVLLNGLILKARVKKFNDLPMVY